MMPEKHVRFGRDEIPSVILGHGGGGTIRLFADNPADKPGVVPAAKA